MSLPIELYVRIFENLHLKDFFNLRLISKYFDAINQETKFRYQIHGNPFNLPNNIIHIKLMFGKKNRFKEIHHIQSINFNGITLKNFDLRGFDSLQSIDISKTLYSEEFFNVLHELNQLERLYTHNHYFSDEMIKSISLIPNLKYLDLSNSNIGDKELNLFSRVKTLKSLNVNKCKNITLNALKNLFNYPNLVHLGIEDIKFNSEYSNIINKLTKLKRLSCGTEKTYFHHIENLTELVELNLSCKKWDQELIRVLSTLKKLKRLSINDYIYFNCMLCGLNQLEELKLGRKKYGYVLQINFNTKSVYINNYISMY
jgi:hypothetical protein